MPKRSRKQMGAAAKAAAEPEKAAEPAPAEVDEAAKPASGYDVAPDAEKVAAGVMADVASARSLGIGPKAARRAIPYKNRQKVLIFSSRGCTSRYRHLMEDMRNMIPHHKREGKLDSKDELRVINDIASMKSCKTTVFFEVRKKRDLYLWFSKTPAGPSIKFHVVNVHTMDELRLTGNCLKGSRPVLSFDAAFEASPHLQLVKEMLTQTFGTPRGHPKSQPFHDHVLSFHICDGKVWLRHYQVVDETVVPKERKAMATQGKQPTSLVEIGPRFVMEIVRIFKGSFGGPTLYVNPNYVSPNKLRHEYNVLRGAKYGARQDAREAREERAETNKLPEDPLRDVFKAPVGDAWEGAGEGDDDDDDEELREGDDEEEEAGEEEDEAAAGAGADEEEEEDEEEEPVAPPSGSKRRRKGKQQR